MSRGTKLSSLWAFVLFNYVYADIIRIIVSPQTYQAAAAKMPPWIMLAATMLMELLIAMVILPIFLSYRFSRPLNIAAGVIGAVFVAVSLGGNPPLAYVFLSAIEIGCSLYIVWYAWTWPAAAE